MNWDSWLEKKSKKQSTQNALLLLSTALMKAASSASFPGTLLGSWFRSVAARPALIWDANTTSSSLTSSWISQDDAGYTGTHCKCRATTQSPYKGKVKFPLSQCLTNCGSETTSETPAPQSCFAVTARAAELLPEGGLRALLAQLSLSVLNYETWGHNNYYQL